MEYTKKTGETSAIKKIFSYLQSQESVRKNILDKRARAKQFAIGDDATLDQERAEVDAINEHRRRMAQANGEKPGVV
ncbi:MAG: hypothetical protein C5B59_12925 [Bacteroidetes bacterium]|nr:MAG: hypothetical protein C5B59_12925 [Bacteroidota bacterium]